MKPLSSRILAAVAVAILLAGFALGYYFMARGNFIAVGYNNALILQIVNA